MLRLLQILDLLLILPILILGFMARMSGGGVNPAFQRIGIVMMYLAPATLILVIASEWLWRNNKTDLAYILLSMPLINWLVLIRLLQIKTKFFYK